MPIRLRTRRAAGGCEGRDVKIFAAKNRTLLVLNTFCMQDFHARIFGKKYPFGVDIFRGFRENFLLFADGSIHDVFDLGGKNICRLL